MDRITKKDIELTFNRLCETYNRRQASTYNDVGALRLDYAACYGGWNIELILTRGGGVKTLYPYRLKTKDFYHAMQLAIQLNLYKGNE